MSDPTTVVTAWLDRAWDAEAGLLWNPPGAFADVTEARARSTSYARRPGAPSGLQWDSNVEATEVRADKWSFPGLQMAVATDARLVDAATRTYTPATGMTLVLD